MCCQIVRRLGTVYGSALSGYRDAQNKSTVARAELVVYRIFYMRNHDITRLRFLADNNAVTRGVNGRPDISGRKKPTTYVDWLQT
jgi:hypothetical protein